MLSPWDILGWMAVAAVGLVLLCVLVFICVCVWRVLLEGLASLRRHFETRDTEPCAGQLWRSATSGRARSIGSVYTDGSVKWWGTDEFGVCDSPESWKKRVRKECLYLEVESKKKESV